MSTRVFAAMAIAAVGVAGASMTPHADEPAARSSVHVSGVTTGRVRFEPNRGQAPTDVSFVGRASDYVMLLEKRSASVTLRSGTESGSGASIELAFAGANPNVEPVGADVLGGTSNYLLGREPAAWQRAVPSYAKVIEPAVYPGIDAVFHSDGQNIEYDFAVAPGADPNVIRLTVRDAEIQPDGGGGLLLLGDGSRLRMVHPVAYQLIGREKRTVTVRYVLYPGPVIGFELGDYDHRNSLVIDPTLAFSTYLGGSGEDVGNFVTTDESGNVYVTGRTTSNDFPSMNGRQNARAGGRDAFVTKYSPSGQMIYSTYFGGTGAENALGIALDPSGAICVTGVTASTDMPVRNAVRSTYGGGPQDGFVFKLTPDGSDLVYSTYLGGTGFDQSRSIAVDADGNAYVAGNTDSPNFPIANALQPNLAGGVSDAFVAKLDASGALIFSTYLGGNDYDGGRGIALDPRRNVYVVGETRGGFPVTAGAFQTSYGGGLNDLFVAKLSSDGAAVLYATYIGGSGTDQNQLQFGTSGGIHGTILAVDRAGNVCVTGDTDSPDFPLKNAYQADKSGDVDAFVLKLNADGTDLVYSTYFGGTGLDTARGIALTTGGRAWIVGSTASGDLPLRSPLQAAFGGGALDAFVAEFSRQGQLRFSSYWGGSGVDAGWSIATDQLDGVTAVGETTSVDFPLLNAGQPFYGGSTADAFVLRLQLED